MKIAINGFGRIGRTILRQILQDKAHADIDVVAINDIAKPEICAYLFQFDSVFGPMAQDVEASQGQLRVGDRSIPLSHHDDLTALDLSEVDVVLECTGKAVSRAVAERGLVAGAKAVLISGPSPAAAVTVVIGANDADLGDAAIVSNASCTTNAIAPMLQTLDTAFGIERAHVTTIHCYTGSQPTVDAPGPTMERSRAAAVSMVPTSTSAASQIEAVLPELAGRLSVTAVRVPCISVSAVDATLQLRHPPQGAPEAELRRLFGQGSVFGVTNAPCVSTDMRARPESLVVALPETRQIDPGQLRLFGWYDNEWGFSARMLEMARRMNARDMQA